MTPSPEDILTRATAPYGDLSILPHALLVFAHPDDETVALGARLGRFRSAHLVHVTDGAPRNEQDSQAQGFASLADYRVARAAEINRMIAMAGISQIGRDNLNFADQEASLHLAELTRTLQNLIGQLQPEAIYTHPYEGGHPDHDACAFAVHHAVAAMPVEDRPAIIECAFYHAGPNGIETGVFLPPPLPAVEVAYPLSAEEQRRKQALIACFATQQKTLEYFPTTHESFRIAPAYDFTQPPHRPPVFYDGFPWGMRSSEFCELASKAERALDGSAGDGSADKEFSGICR